MAFEVIWSPAAVLDIELLVQYIAEDNLRAARKFRDRIITHTEQLGDFPKSGRVVPEFEDESLRELVVRPYRIVYRIDEKRALAEIVRIWHAARGIPGI